MKKLALCLVLCLLAALPASGLPEAQEPVIALDLSKMSGTVVYAQIYNLMYDPEPWLGKVIRMSGYYNYFNDTARGVVYHACIVPDAAACCTQGIEFVRAGTFAWPDDYPELGDPITVTGRLEIYEENGTRYLHLTDAEMVRDADREGL